MKKIIFVGPPGSGKSTLISEVFCKLKIKGYTSEIVAEFARQYIQEYGPPSSIFEQLLISREQDKRERNINQSIDYLLIDAGALSSYFYVSLYANYQDKKHRLVVNTIYERFLDDLYSQKYNYVFFLPTLETYKTNPSILNDGTRFQTPDEINTLECHMLLMFTRLHRQNNIYTITCPLEDRANQVLKIIS